MNPTSDDVFKVSDYLHQQANAIGECIQKNKLIYGDEDRNTLFNDQIDLLRISGKLNMLGVAMVFDDVQQTISDLDVLTDKLQTSVKTALKVERAINFATCLVNLGTAIILKDPKLIVQKTTEAFKTFGIKVKNPLTGQ